MVFTETVVPSVAGFPVTVVSSPPITPPLTVTTVAAIVSVSPDLVGAVEDTCSLIVLKIEEIVDSDAIVEPVSPAEFVDPSVVVFLVHPIPFVVPESEVPVEPTVVSVNTSSVLVVDGVSVTLEATELSEDVDCDEPVAPSVPPVKSVNFTVVPVALVGLDELVELPEPVVAVKAEAPVDVDAGVTVETLEPLAPVDPAVVASVDNDPEGVELVRVGPLVVVEPAGIVGTEAVEVSGGRVLPAGSAVVPIICSISNC